MFKFGQRTWEECKMCLGDGTHPNPEVPEEKRTCTKCFGKGKIVIQELRQLKITDNNLIEDKQGSKIFCPFNDSQCGTFCAALRQKENEKNTRTYICCERLPSPVGEIICEDINAN